MRLVFERRCYRVNYEILMDGTNNVIIYSSSQIREPFYNLDQGLLTRVGLVRQSIFLHRPDIGQSNRRENFRSTCPLSSFRPPSSSYPPSRHPARHPTRHPARQPALARHPVRYHTLLSIQVRPAIQLLLVILPVIIVPRVVLLLAEMARVEDDIKVGSSGKVESIASRCRGRCRQRRDPSIKAGFRS